MKWCSLLILGLFLVVTTEAQTRRRAIHIPKPHFHRIKYLHLKREDVQFDISADIFQRQLSFTNTINLNPFFNSASLGLDLGKNFLFADEAGWTNNNETFSALFNGSKNWSSKDAEYYIGAKGERVLGVNKKLSFPFYTYPKWSITHHQLQFEEGTGFIYNFSHGFIGGYDISVLHANLKYFQTSMSLALVKIL